MNTRYLLLLLWLILTTAFLSACATERVTRNLNDRFTEIAAKIDKAEILGAKDCTPRELARAKAELDRTLHEVQENYHTTGELHVGFDLSENFANELLVKLRLDTNLGRCQRYVVPDHAYAQF